MVQSSHNQEDAMEDTYQVEGINYDDFETALKIAKRFYARYKKSKTIIVYAIDSYAGVKTVSHAILAKREDNTRCPDTVDMFGGL